jgi:trehalose 6-phosphate synthase
MENATVTVIVVSNRIARAKTDEPISGGLAAALIPMVRDSGAIWVGTNDSAHKDSAHDTRQPCTAEPEQVGKGALARVNIPAHQYRGFYEGFANSALWPALHSRADLIQVTAEDYAAYRDVNVCMARALLGFAEPDALYWIHDYHFLTLAAELRRFNIARPIGFFLHTPWAARSIMTAVPNHRELVRAMLAYDLVGFQTDEDRQNFEDYVKAELGLTVIEGTVDSEWGLTRLATFPIGIDVDDFAARATRAIARPDVARLRTSLQGARLAFGVDRLDYSKGLASRMRAFDRMLTNHPELKRGVSFLQIAVPSRGNIRAYRELKSELAALVGEINGRHGEVDWIPIRYLNRGFAQSTLAGFYRAAHVGLVTPLQDGMNLVAKEYVAAQNPFDPGVLVLSEFAGAAKELDAALLVNPHDIDGMARQIAVALSMPLEERRARWHAMIGKLRTASVQNWFSEFLQALAEVRRTPARPPNAPLVLELAGRGRAQRH